MHTFKAILIINYPTKAMHKINAVYAITIKCLSVIDWLIEQSLTSPPTQYRLYRRRFLQVKRPNQQYQSTERDATKDKEKNENN